ncbi:MAG: hypothetical protein ABR582_05560 [Gemmatimonadaceae bacterium]
MSSPLDAWENFYIIIGSSAGALTGLQFVVMALIADSREGATNLTVDTFGTPTIVHFCVVLLLAAIVSAPWSSLTGAAILFGILGIWGISYVTLIFLRTRKVTEYQPVLEDWIFHVALPFIAYGLLLAGAFSLVAYPVTALFMIGSMGLILLFTGIHNAWDTVKFIVVEKMGPRKKSNVD